MRPFVHKEPNRMPIDGHLDGKVVRCARFDDVARHRIVVRVDQRLVQVEHERLAWHQTQAMAGHRRQGEHVVLDRLILRKLRGSYQKNKKQNRRTNKKLGQ